MEHPKVQINIQGLFDPEDLDATKIIIEYISRQIGVSASKIAYLGQDVRKNWLFEVL